jgi:Ulp1 family protease
MSLQSKLLVFTCICFYAIFIIEMYVFILINIWRTHWYLVVINVRNMEIQVLDSFSTSFDRKNLTHSMSVDKLNNYESLIN